MSPAMKIGHERQGDQRRLTGRQEIADGRRAVRSATPRKKVDVWIAPDRGLKAQDGRRDDAVVRRLEGDVGHAWHTATSVIT